MKPEDMTSKQLEELAKKKKEEEQQNKFNEKVEKAKEALDTFENLKDLNWSVDNHDRLSLIRNIEGNTFILYFDPTGVEICIYDLQDSFLQRVIYNTLDYCDYKIAPHLLHDDDENQKELKDIYNHCSKITKVINDLYDSAVMGKHWAIVSSRIDDNWAIASSRIDEKWQSFIKRYE